MPERYRGRSDHSRARGSEGRPPAAEQAERAEQIEGRNPVMEALRADRPLNKLLVARGAGEGSIRAILGLAREKGVLVQEVERTRLDAMAEGRVHQGVIALAAPRRYAEPEEILALARERGEDPFVLVLDGLEDPHNIGSLLRTAECVGAHGAILPERRAAPITPAAVKASAGAAEHLPVARVTNLVQTLEWLKEQGLWIAGTDAEGPQLYTESNLTGPLALVIGSEGKGMGRLVREHCDLLVRLPLRGRITSLNASVAGGVLMYEVLRQRDAKAAKQSTPK